MLLDKNFEFADAVSVAAAAGTANIGDIINLRTIGYDAGNGEPLYLVITIDTEVITGGAAGTIQFKLVSDSTTTIAVDGSATLHASSPVFVTDDAAANSTALNAGEIAWVVALPPGFPAYEQYLALQATIATTTVTAGAINAFLTSDPRVWKAYADAQN